MIGSNYESMPDFTVSNEQLSGEDDFLKNLCKKDKEKITSHGEDVNTVVFDYSQKLHRKKKELIGSVNTALVKNNKPEKTDSLISEVISREKLRQATRMEGPATNDNSNSLNSLLPGSQSSTADLAISELLDAVAHTDDMDTKEQRNETIKTQSLALQQKYDAIQLRTEQQRAEQQRQEVKPRFSSASVAERVHQANASLSALNNNAVEQKKSLNLDYPFSRWSGEHSVKVRISADTFRAGNLTFIPSDPRSADVLSKQIGHLNGYVAEVLHPQNDDEDPERRNLTQAWEEEQE